MRKSAEHFSYKERGDLTLLTLVLKVDVLQAHNGMMIQCPHKTAQVLQHVILIKLFLFQIHE